MYSEQRKKPVENYGREKYNVMTLLTARLNAEGLERGRKRVKPTLTYDHPEIAWARRRRKPQRSARTFSISVERSLQSGRRLATRGWQVVRELIRQNQPHRASTPNIGFGVRGIGQAYVTMLAASGASGAYTARSIVPVFFLGLCDPQSA